MGQNNYSKILYFLAWLILGGLSCWATSESLYLSFSESAAFPKIFFWIIVVLFFVVTSLGTGWMVEALMSRGYVEHRYLKLFGGLAIVIFFWLCISMPTNAHTFLYSRSARPVAQKEIKYLEGQLESVIDSNAYMMALSADFYEKMEGVKEQRERLVDEINHPERPGISVEVDKILLEIERMLEIPAKSFNRPLHSYSSLGSQKERNKWVAYYSDAIDRQIAVKTADETAKWMSIFNSENRRSQVKEVKKAIKGLEAANRMLDDGGVNQEKALIIARKQINAAYGCLDKAKGGAVSSRDAYAKEKRCMPSSRLINVREVIGDYLRGDLQKKYDMQEVKGMIYLILLSILVDAAAFLFFNLFKNSIKNGGIPSF